MMNTIYPVTPTDSLSLFHPLIQEWIINEYGSLSPIQTAAFPPIAKGENVLLIAPTGSGKTIAAFLWALNCFLQGDYPVGDGPRALYISPLKALNNDIEQNLIYPLNQLRELFHINKTAFPFINVGTRSGDTPPAHRARMLRKPPEILITTPESLNLIIISPKARHLLDKIKVVILDEIHALAGDKRGVFLTSVITHLSHYCGEFQRIAISATVNPPETIARFAAGYRLENTDGTPHYIPRPITIIQAPSEKKYRVNICSVPIRLASNSDETHYKELARVLKKIILKNKSTLIFTNTRRLCETLAALINAENNPPLVYSHHGSLSREIRHIVEKGLKQGEIKGIIATSSLELGIDIGDLDEVVMVQAPQGFANGLQRVGRAGHDLRRISQGTIFPLYPIDTLYSLVMAQAIETQTIEPIQIILNPLDMLAQFILILSLDHSWQIDALYDFIRTNASFHTLERELFNATVDMLSGRFQHIRLKELQPRLDYNSRDQTIRSKPGIRSLLYASAGAIPDRGSYQLVLGENNKKIGELDEEFVWERRLGDRFEFGNRRWKIVNINQRTVEVVPWSGSTNTALFWRGESMTRSLLFSNTILNLLEQINDHIERNIPLNELWGAHFQNPEDPSDMEDLFKRQRAHSNAPLPHSRHILCEQAHNTSRGDGFYQLIIHTFRSLSINYPLAAGLNELLEKRFAQKIDFYSDNNSIVFNLPQAILESELRSYLRREKLENAWRVHLGKTGYFGARFRENASRALLLPRSNFRSRVPLWLSRVKSKQLYQAIAPYSDFPILLETWRNCFHDEFNIPALYQLLEDIEGGTIAISLVDMFCYSPLAAGIIWLQTSINMYQDDTPRQTIRDPFTDPLGEKISGSRWESVPFDPLLLSEFQMHQKRLSIERLPQNETDFFNWLEDRIFLDCEEWQQQFKLLKQTHPIESWLKSLQNRICWIERSDAGTLLLMSTSSYRLLCQLLPDWNQNKIFGYAHKNDSAGENLETINFQELGLSLMALASAGLNSPQMAEPIQFSANTTLPTIEFILEQWLRYYPGIEIEYFSKIFGFAENRLHQLLERQLEKRRWVLGKKQLSGNMEWSYSLPRDNELKKLGAYWLIDHQVLQNLLKNTNRYRSRQIESLPLELLPAYIARIQHLDSETQEKIPWPQLLEPLLAYPLMAELWEREVFPSRISGYQTEQFDSFYQSQNLQWVGCGKEKIMFTFPEELSLFQLEQKPSYLLADNRDYITLTRLSESLGLPLDETAEKLWEEVWSGKITNEQWSVLRKGILNRFKALPITKSSVPSRGRHNFNRWLNTRPFEGRWFIPRKLSEPPDSAWDELENQKFRIRQLIKRYGIICRDLLKYELPVFQWSNLVSGLKVMELSGELTAGIYFTHLSFPQYMATENLKNWTEFQNHPSHFILNATDPASLSGLGLFSDLPERHSANHFVYAQNKIVLISRMKARDIEIAEGASAETVIQAFRLFYGIVQRRFKPWKVVKVETINQQPALKSHWREHFEAFGFKPDYHSLIYRYGF